jgi:hypothetical protein
MPDEPDDEPRTMPDEDDPLAPVPPVPSAPPPKSLLLPPPPQPADHSTMLEARMETKTRALRGTFMAPSFYGKRVFLQQRGVHVFLCR